MSLKVFVLCVLLSTACCLSAQQPMGNFRVRTITAGITLRGLSDTASFNNAVQFLLKAKEQFIAAGYAVQTLRISTQHLYLYLDGHSYNEAIAYLQVFDKIAQQNHVIISVGQILPPDIYQPGIADWAEKLVQSTSTISFSLPISSHEKGIHYQSIKAAAEIISTISKTRGGEDCFRFTTAANCPSNIPFFPVAFHEGVNSFAIGLESANLVKEAFEQNKNPATARQTLKQVFEKNLLPVQKIAESISQKSKLPYDGIDASPAPGLDASIGEAIETFSGQPFGSPATLAACALITDVLKSLDVKKCGYSGLMLPVIEDKVLAKRAMEGRFNLQQLLLFSTVSGTGLDVVPIPGDTPIPVLENIFADVAALSLKYTAKALSARLFLIPGKKSGDIVNFTNPSLTQSVVMKAE